MTLVYDNFVRANGALGGSWATPVPNQAEFATWTGTPAGNVLINSNGVGPDATNGLDCACLWAGGQSFGNDQWAQATFKTVAGPTATLAISAAVQAAGNTTYTYTVTAGDAATPISGGFLYVIISGMADAGNNGHFTATSFAAGTFTVANASGVTRAGQSGVGFCSSDSGCGVGIRFSGTSAATLNGYFFHIGSNSFGGGGRKFYYELWKVVNGVGTDFMHCGDTTTLATLSPVAGTTTFGISAVGTLITAYVNGAVLTGGALTNGIYQVTDSSIASGVPAITTFAVGGASEYNFTAWASGSTQFAGNNGTTINNFTAGDGITGSGVPVYSETFVQANGPLNANWTANPSPDVALATSSNLAVASVAGVRNGDYYSVPSPALPADQYSEATLVASNGASLLQASVRQSAAAQTRYFMNITGPLGSSASIALFKLVAGVQTQIGSTLTSQTIATLDVFRISVRATTITVYRNGVQKIQQTDSAIATGFAGMCIQPVTAVTNETVSLWSGSAALGTMSGSAGIAGAIVSWTGATAGMVVADGSGNFTITGPTGSYVITPILAGYSFSPSSSSQTLGATDLTGVNFTASVVSASAGGVSPIMLA